MSYSSCSNSALYKPADYPIGAIGSINEPTINLNPVASGALYQPISALTLPEGRWLIAGTLFVDATTAGQSISGNTGIAKDAVVFWRSATDVVASLSITLSAIVESDGTNVITIPMNYTTSGGADYNVAPSPLSKVQFIRIA